MEFTIVKMIEKEAFFGVVTSIEQPIIKGKNAEIRKKPEHFF